jgi:hypothetical protein
MSDLPEDSANSNTNYPLNPSNSSQGGFYQPDSLTDRFAPDYQDFLNRTNGTLSIQIRDGLSNIVNMMPNLYAIQTQIAAEPVMWLRRKIYGQICPNIRLYGFSETSEGECAVSKCPLCYGTTWLGGYDAPIKLEMSFNPQKADIDINQAGLVIQETPTAWTIDTDPIMKEMDMIITYSNIRYLIMDQESEEKKGKRMYQRLNLTRLDEYDVAYSVPVPSVYGDAHTDFQATITINQPHADFLATIVIYNEYWYPVDGQNDGTTNAFEYSNDTAYQDLEFEN